jgi:hypothetical protein
MTPEQNKQFITYLRELLACLEEVPQKELGGVMVHFNTDYFDAIRKAMRDNPDMQHTIVKVARRNRGSGGPLPAGMPYIAGERGPEWFVPREPNLGWFHSLIHALDQYLDRRWFKRQK